MNYNPIRRTPLCPVKTGKKPQKQRGEWHPQVVRLDSSGMATLRSEAFVRSNGFCECGDEDCNERVTWYSGQLHHRIARGQGGSDIISNVLFLTPGHHAKIHGVPEWSKRA